MQDYFIIRTIVPNPVSKKLRGLRGDYTPMINVHSVSVNKSGNTILTNFSWAIQRGQHWIIRGENGSGKTLLLELIAGVITPAQGSVEYDFIQSTDWSDRYSERKKKIHYVSAHAMNNFLAGHHDLFYQQRYYEIEESAIPRVRDLIDVNALLTSNFKFPLSFKIDEFLDLEVTRLSNGQLKKVLLLKTFIQNVPSVLLLDYPFEGLDHESRKELIEFIDYFVNHHSVHLIMVDHHDNLPTCINRILTINQDTTNVGNYIKAADLIDTHQTVSELNTSGAPPIVDLHNVTIQYGDRVIINELNWKITQGQRWALTGRNGCGKTTLFSLLYADHPMAYTQNIFLFGRKRGSGESIWDIKKRINYFGPEHLHYLNAKIISTSARNYLLGLHTSESESKLNGLISFFDASGFIDKPVRSLSSGDLQCMLLINFFLDERELLLLDEPFQFLDARRTEKVNEYLGYFLRPETTLILITHIEEEIRRWTRHRLRL